jgi:SAM-dependent methyltransferase
MRISLPSLLVALTLLGCHTAHDRPPGPVEEASVKPGVNDRFLAPDVDIEQFTQTFEGESREIAVHKERIVRALEITAGAKIADVGAGTGLFLGDLQRAVGAKGKVYAVDISPGFIEHLEGRVRREGLDHVEVVLCSEHSVELPAASIDAAFVCDTYHHFEYPRATLSSLHRALVRDGILYVVDFERIPGVSREWLLDHVRADKQTFTAEIVAAGFELEREIEVEGLKENYLLRFRRR